MPHKTELSYKAALSYKELSHETEVYQKAWFIHGRTISEDRTVSNLGLSFKTRLSHLARLKHSKKT